MRNLTKAAAVAAAVAILLAGCSSTPSSSSGSGKGGTLTILTPATQINLDPAKSQNLATTSLSLIERRLTTWEVKPGQAAKVVPDLATNTGTASDGGKTWTYTLKDGLKFQDGTPDHQPGHQVRRRALVLRPAHRRPRATTSRCSSAAPTTRARTPARPRVDRDSGREDHRLPPERLLRRLAVDRLHARLHPGAQGEGQPATYGEHPRRLRSVPGEVEQGRHRADARAQQVLELEDRQCSHRRPRHGRVQGEPEPVDDGSEPDRRHR